MEYKPMKYGSSNPFPEPLVGYWMLIELTGNELRKYENRIDESDKNRFEGISLTIEFLLN